MSPLYDVTTDLPKLADLRAVRGLTAEEAASLAEELTTYHQHLLHCFTDASNASGRPSTYADCSRLMSPARMWKRWPCVCWEWGRMRSGRCAPSNSSSGKGPGMMTPCWQNTSTW